MGRQFRSTGIGGGGVDEATHVIAGLILGVHAPELEHNLLVTRVPGIVQRAAVLDEKVYHGRRDSSNVQQHERDTDTNHARMLAYIALNAPISLKKELSRNAIDLHTFE